MEIKVEKSEILDEFKTYVNNGITGLLGPSGCGKTTLLNFIFDTHNDVAYVPQDIYLHNHLTIRETIQTSLCFQNSHNNSQVDVMELLSTLELDFCSNTLVCKASGGEKKRCSIAIELLSKPKLFLFDEPFSSLDSYNTDIMYNMIKNKLKDIPVILTIHQPNGTLFYDLKNVWLMTRGIILYDDTPKNVIDYFETRGHKLKMHESGPEFAISCLQNISKYVHIEKNLYNTQKIHNISLNENSLSLHDKSVMSNTFDIIFNKVYALSKREMLENIRNPMFIKIRILQNIIFSTFVGLLYLNIDNTQRDVQNKSGAIFFIAINQVMTNIFGTLQIFPECIRLLKYDYSRHKYSLFSYYCVKTTCDLPFQIFNTLIFGIISVLMTNLTSNIHMFIYILSLISLCSSSFGYMMSTISNDSKICLIVSNLITLPMMLTSGFFINNGSIPIYLVWIKYINPFYYAFNAISIVVWKNTSLTCDTDLCLFDNGNAVIEYQKINTKNNVMMLFLLSCLFRTIGYFILCVTLKKNIVYK